MYGRNAFGFCALLLAVSSSSAVGREKSFDEPRMPSGCETNRPYEIVWAGRTVDDHPSLLPFTSADGWSVRATDAVASLETSRERLLFGDATCKFTFRATGPKATVTLTPPAPVKVASAFDALTWWIHGLGRPWRKPHIPLFVDANFTDAGGRPFSVRFPEINHSEWFLVHRKLKEDERMRAKDGAMFVSFTLTGMTNDVDRSVYLNSFCAFHEELKPLTYRPRARRPHRVFPAADAGTNTGTGELPFPNSPRGVIPRTSPTDDLEFRLPAKATAWDDLAFRWAGGPWVAFARRGGLFFDDGGKDLVALAEVEVEVVTNSAAPLDVMLRTMQRTADGRSFRSEVRFHVIGRSLVADVQSEGPVGEVRFGGWDAPDAELVPVPYYTYVPWGNGLRPQVVSTRQRGRPFFHAAILDWTQSTCSEPIGGSVRDGLALSNYGAVYRKKTDGTRNRCFERLVYAFSDRFEDVLPEIPNPKSPWMHVTGKGVWVSHKAGVRADDIAHWRARRARGIRHLIVTDHETGWRDGKESFTFRTEPAPGKGGNRGQYEYARVMIDELGYRYGPYNNFTDFAPVNAHWTSDRVIRLPDGALQDAWDRCYAPKPAYAVEACEDLTPRIQEKFGFNCAYCDVHTSPSPWWRVDYDARVPGAGTFAATFYSWGEIMLIQKRAWNGPVYSEGGMHHIYCGLTDGNYGQDMNYRLPENPWIVDYDLLKMHPLCCNFGIGAPYMFYETVTPPADRDEAIDRFLAATVAFGHPGFFVSDPDPKAAEKFENRSYFMIQALAAHYTQATVREIRYLDADGNAHATSDALANGVYRRSQVRVRYSDGTVVEVNGSKTEPMRLPDGTTLPPNGYRGRSGDGKVEVFSGLVDGHRVDRAVSPEYVFLDGRGVKTSFPEGEATGQVIRLVEAERKLTPVMGWSSWNSFGGGVSYDKVKAQMDALVRLGLRDLGWTYVNIDDCFQNGRDGKTGRLRVNEKKFPGGYRAMRELVDYAHANGLRAGIYSDGGDHACSSGGGSGSVPEGRDIGFWRHEVDDTNMYLADGVYRDAYAQTHPEDPGIACWGFDFIKIDWCGGGHAKLNDRDQYNRIMDAIDDVERRMGKQKIVNICRWDYVGDWQFRADSWRSGPDIASRGDSWESVMVQVDIMKEVWQYTRPGSMNDPDMLVAGLGLTTEEDRSHFAMWCMFSSPLLIGQDITKIKPETLALYRNTELIALDQDPAVLSAGYLGDLVPGVEIWVKLLGNDRGMTRAVALLNRNSTTQAVDFAYSLAGYTGKAKARDLFAHADLPDGTHRRVTLPPHGIDVLKLEPADGRRVIGPRFVAGRGLVSHGADIEATRRVDWVNAFAAVRGGAKLLDVRSGEEFAAGHVGGAVNVPHTRIAADIRGLVPDTNTPIVCYCKQYKRAAQAAILLDMLGYRKVEFVGDGYEAAKDAPRTALADVTVTVVDVKGDGKGKPFWASSWSTPWPSAKGRPNAGWGGKPISIAGKAYATGFGTEASVRGGGALVYCRIPKGATHFAAAVGVDDNSPVKDAAVRFAVHVDDVCRSETRPLAFGESQLLVVPLAPGAREVKLFTTGDRPVHASWGGAGFVTVD